MKHKFTLAYELPDSWYNWLKLEPCIQRLGNTGFEGGAVDDTALSLWFDREAESRTDAITGAMEAVADVLPEAKFVEAR